MLSVVTKINTIGAQREEKQQQQQTTKAAQCNCSELGGGGVSLRITPIVYLRVHCSRTGERASTSEDAYKDWNPWKIMVRLRNNENSPGKECRACKQRHG